MRKEYDFSNGVRGKHSKDFAESRTIVWLDARTLYRDLAIPEFYLSFEDWFTVAVQGEFKEGEEWKVELLDKGNVHEGNTPTFRITQAVADQIARDEIGPPVERMRHYTRTAEFSKINWNQRLSEQTHAITGDEE